jgi:VanZ family protein
VWWLRPSRIGVLIVAPAILLLSLLPDVPAATKGVGDKIPHLVAYAVLGFLLFLARGNTGPRSLALTVMLCALYGGAIEILQNFTGRNMELGDWAADLAGALAGSLAASAARRFLPPSGAQRPKL